MAFLPRLEDDGTRSSTVIIVYKVIRKKGKRYREYHDKRSGTICVRPLRRRGRISRVHNTMGEVPETPPVKGGCSPTPVSEKCHANNDGAAGGCAAGADAVL